MPNQTWTITGRIDVRHLLPELQTILGARSPVAGVTVKVSARSKILGGWGTWASWGTTTTDDDGSFSISKRRGSDRRQFRVKVLFDDDRLRIKEGGETQLSFGGGGFPVDVHVDLTDRDWHELHDDRSAMEDGRRAGVHDLGTLDASPRLVREHADIWVLYHLVFDQFDRMGTRFGLDRKQVVKYPMGIANNASNSASYANPLNGVVYIKGSDFESRTLLHELMHQWTYDRTTGEDGMAWQLVKHGETHAPREATTFVPFHEAFADWSAYQLLAKISDGRLEVFEEANSKALPNQPYTRTHLGAALGDSERVLANVDFTERGWHSLFTLLAHPSLARLDVNTPTSGGSRHATTKRMVSSSCRHLDSDLGFRKVCDVLNVHAGVSGADTALGNVDLRIPSILDRAQRVHDDLTDDDVEAVLLCLDPNATANPCDGGSSTGVGRVRVERKGPITGRTLATKGKGFVRQP